MMSVSTHDFASAAQDVIAFLHKRLGFGLWMVTRVEGDDWIVLQSEDHGYGVAPGKVFSWAESFCVHMVQGQGPRIAPASDKISAYAAAPIGKQVAIGAYIGVPLVKPDGALFGTLCAIDPAQQPASIAGEQALIELLAGLLSSILQSDLQASDAARRAERLDVEAHTEPMTGLHNRRAWDQMLTREEERCRRFGHPVTVVVVDLDGLKTINDTQGHAAGDALIVRAGAALRHAARDVDLVARLGGDEFGMLALDCDQAGAEALTLRVRAALADAQLKACVGVAVRRPQSGLAEAWQRADQHLYNEKRAR
jgi:diguanylate cyclase